ncbi:flagellar hook assembly protein FlgD [Tardiphaga sp.]|jgi:flagellar basal-body rod modification protein FlgD|uniref:flagellar hook assembly protein FlgD n=1 Tax=Tardiphaga sp. TaxID=1926292 RepID=UPI0037D9C8DA
MAVDATYSNPVVSGTSTNTNTSTNTSSSTGLADNFQTFLTLLTTQLQNQNPLDPLDTNQFTQQLVQFAQVEQQLKSNDQLKSLVEMEKATQATQALVYVGNNVAVDGATAQFKTSATWNLLADKASTADISITNSAGNVVYSGKYSLQSGEGTFVWDGKGNDGVQYPEGAYTLTATAKDDNGRDVGVSTEVQGVVDSVDLSASPALLSINGSNYTVDKIKRVVRATSTPTPTPTPST